LITEGTTKLVRCGEPGFEGKKEAKNFQMHRYGRTLKEVTSMSNYTSHKIKGLLSMFALVTVATLAVPYTALGAGRGAGNSGAVGRSGSFRQQTFSHGFRHSRFFDGDGFVGDGFDGGDVTVEQSQPAPTVAPVPVNRRYVQPHWVDGGYGVEVLEPGYWVSTDKE
jgi:hypothetical protein